MEHPMKISPLANDYVEVARSPKPLTHYHGSCSVCDAGWQPDCKL